MRNLIRSTVIGVTLALIVAGSSLADPHFAQVGNLLFRDDGGISPTKLPKHKQAPVKAYLSASVKTTDGTHPPPAREAIVDVDKNIHVNAKGLPVCKGGQLQSRNTDAARRVCGKAIVGTGSAQVEIEFPEQKPIMTSSPLTLFNGGVKGSKTTVFVHAFITVPVPAAVVTPVEITRIRRGHYDIHTVSKIPAIAGGAGSLTRVELRIDRKFIYEGRKSGFLTASCPTQRHFIKGRVLFGDGTLVNLSRVLPCTPRDR